MCGDPNDDRIPNHILISEGEFRLQTRANFYDLQSAFPATSRHAPEETMEGFLGGSFPGNN